MTEAEWLTATDPTPMLEFVRDKVSDRKWRLFGCSCCRWVWRLMPDNACRRAVEVAERFADGIATVEEWSFASKAAEPAIAAATTAAAMDAADAATDAASDIQEAANAAAWAGVFDNAEGQTELAQRAAAFSVQREIQSGFIRDIFGNPFRPVTVDHRWRTETVVALASSIYTERAFDRMPILADALEDSGCDHADILAHCRGEGPHVRGCWVVDLLLGKQ